MGACNFGTLTLITQVEFVLVGVGGIASGKNLKDIHPELLINNH